MDDRTVAHLSAATGLTATLAVGFTVLASTVLGEPPVAPVAPGWWVLYALYLLAFAWDGELLPGRPRWVTERLGFAVLLTTGTVAWLLSAHLGWTAVLLVVTAASAAYLLPPRAVLAVVAVQSLAVAVGVASTGASEVQTVLAVLVYGSFQGFAVLLVSSEQREASARAALEATHAELRAATALLETSTRDAERLRIARELHDVLGSQLTALSLELEVAAHHAGALADPATAAHVGRARAIAKDLLGAVRATVSELRAPGAGLAETLEAVVRDLPGLQVELTVEERVPLDERRAIALVRCVQEVATNTLRHAHAHRLDVRVEVDADGAYLEASDDGVGAAALTPGNGLTGMCERVEQLGGRLVVDGRPGRGLRVTASLPAPPPRPATGTRPTERASS